MAEKQVQCSASQLTSSQHQTRPCQRALLASRALQQGNSACSAECVQLRLFFLILGLLNVKESTIIPNTGPGTQASQPAVVAEGSPGGAQN